MISLLIRNFTKIFGLLSFHFLYLRRSSHVSQSVALLLESQNAWCGDSIQDLLWTLSMELTKHFILNFRTHSNYSGYSSLREDSINRRIPRVVPMLVLHYIQSIHPLIAWIQCNVMLSDPSQAVSLVWPLLTFQFLLLTAPIWGLSSTTPTWSIWRRWCWMVMDMWVLISN